MSIISLEGQIGGILFVTEHLNSGLGLWIVFCIMIIAVMIKM